MLLMASAVVSAQSNLVVNPGFTNGTQGWSTDCTIEINPESVYGGNNSNPVSEIDIERCLRQEIAVSAGAMYDFSFKAGRRQGSTPATVGITVKVIGVPSGTVYLNQNRTYTNTSWGLTTESFSFTVPANTTDTRVKIQFNNYITPGTYGTLIDDISLSVNAQSAVLPIRLTNFYANLKTNVALLSWTAQNENNDGSHFIIEKLSRQNIFDSIGKVAVSNTGAYSFADKNLFSGNNQYRLKAINRNGTYTYSNIVSIEYNTTTGFNIYPNPATSTINYSVNSNVKSTASLMIYNISGALLVSRQVRLEEGPNSISMDISSLKTGSFYIKLADNEGMSYVKSFCKK